jgi:acetolactate synthase-1/2/3 large subunit
MMVGGGGWSKTAARDITEFAVANDIPVCASFRCQDIVDNRLGNYVGSWSLATNAGLVERMQTTDLLLVVGARLGELTTQGYTTVVPPRPKQPLVHVHADADELGRVYQGELLIASGMAEFAAAARALPPVDAGARPDWTQGARRDYLAALELPPGPGTLDLGDIVRQVNATLPEDALIATDAGNFASWVNRLYQVPGYRTLAGPTSGAMGYGVPAAVAAKLLHPAREVVCFVGDGGFMMTGQELATAVQYDAAIIILLVNNGLYGTIRMHQEREYPGRTPATDLKNPDFAALARAYGAHGETVSETSGFAAAFDRARKSGLPALLDLRLDPEAIAPGVTATELREAALARHGAAR